MSFLTQIISNARIILLLTVHFLSLFFVKVISNQNVFEVTLMNCLKTNKAEDYACKYLEFHFTFNIDSA